MFRDRQDAARQLAGRLRRHNLTDPLVLAIPRGGVVLGAVLACELGADLDVVLSRKLRSPDQPELALGAVSESGEVFLAPHAQENVNPPGGYLEEERRHQLAEIARHRNLFRAIRPRAAIAGRSVIVTDDGVSTGSTMIAALQSIKSQGPRELIVAVPVLARDRLKDLWTLCDEAVFLLAPSSFWAIGQFYEDFRQVEDDQVCDILRSFAAPGRHEQPTCYANGSPRQSMPKEAI